MGLCVCVYMWECICCCVWICVGVFVGVCVCVSLGWWEGFQEDIPTYDFEKNVTLSF